MSIRKLDDLFTAYERRKQAEEKAAAEKAAHEQREREAAVEVFRKRLVPPLQAIAADIRGRGHQANVVESFDRDFPTVSLDFTPAARTGFTEAPLQSRVAFSWKGGEGVETLQEVARSASRGITERWRLVEVNPEWVSRQAFAMIEAALRNH